MTQEWTDEQQLLTLIRRELYSAVIGDILDEHGYVHQFLPPQLRPLVANMVVVGRAMPVLEEDIDVFDAAEPFGLMLRALDDLQRGEVYVATGGSPRYALWGELMSTAARARGCVGAILNGYARDTHGILAMDFPVFALGSYAQDQRARGRVSAYRVEVQVGNTCIQPGDMIVGDIDGVVVVPASVERVIFSEALAKSRAEKVIKTELEQGMSANAAFRKHGIL